MEENIITFYLILSLFVSGIYLISKKLFRKYKKAFLVYSILSMVGGIWRLNTVTSKYEIPLFLFVPLFSFLIIHFFELLFFHKYGYLLPESEKKRSYTKNEKFINRWNILIGLLIVPLPITPIIFYIILT